MDKKGEKFHSELAYISLAVKLIQEHVAFKKTFIGEIDSITSKTLIQNIKNKSSPHLLPGDKIVLNPETNLARKEQIITNLISSHKTLEKLGIVKMEPIGRDSYDITLIDKFASIDPYGTYFINFIEKSVAIKSLQAKAKEIETADDDREKIADEEERKIEISKTIPATKKETLIKARRGQGKFRQAVFDLEKRSRLSGISIPELLIAGHVKPWANCDDIERLNPNNGYLFSPNEDLLFGKGWMTYAEDGSIICIDQSLLEILNVDPTQNVGEFNEEQKMFLRYHQEYVYKGEV